MKNRPGHRAGDLMYIEAADFDEMYVIKKATRKDCQAYGYLAKNS